MLQRLLAQIIQCSKLYCRKVSGAEIDRRTAPNGCPEIRNVTKLSTRWISKDRNIYSLVQISRIDGHTLGIQGCHTVSPRSDNHQFGPIVRIGGRNLGLNLGKRRACLPVTPQEPFQVSGFKIRVSGFGVAYNIARTQCGGSHCLGARSRAGPPPPHLEETSVFYASNPTWPPCIPFCEGLVTTEPPWRAFRFCIETFNPWMVNRIEVNSPEEVCQLCGLETAKVPKLP